MKVKLPDEFNEREWLSNYYGGAQVPWDSFDNIRNFVFFWSLFEKKLCENNANATSICDGIDVFVNKRKISINEFQNIYNYFKGRYTSSGKVNSRFKQLSFRKHDKEEFVKAVLENENPTVGDMLKGLLIIVYRLRNNLFHGGKRVEILHTQIDNFKATNELLAKIIESFD